MDPYFPNRRRPNHERMISELSTTREGGQGLRPTSLYPVSPVSQLTMEDISPLDLRHSQVGPPASSLSPSIEYGQQRRRSVQVPQLEPPHAGLASAAPPDGWDAGVGESQWQRPPPALPAPEVQHDDGGWSRWRWRGAGGAGVVDDGVVGGVGGAVGVGSPSEPFSAATTFAMPLSVEDDKGGGGAWKALGGFTVIEAPRAEGGREGQPWQGPTQQQQQRPPHVFRYWAAELAALVVCVAFLIAIAIVLAKFQGVPQPKWSFGMSINSLIAIFSTVLRATMIMVVAEVISQSKWRFFDSSHSLGDLERFDSASRGLWGSVKLLFMRSKPQLSMLAAIVMIVSWAVGPFTQQAIRTYVCQVPMVDERATVPLARYVDATDVDPFVGHPFPAYYLLNPMQSAIVNGMQSSAGVVGGGGAVLGKTSATAAGLGFTCKTGDCTFADQEFIPGVSYSTAGLCSRCVDITSSVRQLSKAPKLNSTGSTVLNLTVLEGDAMFITQGYASNFLSVSADSIYPFLPDADVGSGNITILTYTFGTEGCAMEKVLKENNENPRGGKFQKWKCPGKRASLPNVPDMPDTIDVLAVNCTLYPCLRHYKAEVKGGQLMETLVGSARMKGPVKGQVDRSVLLEPCMVDGKAYYRGNISERAPPGSLSSSSSPSSASPASSGTSSSSSPSPSSSSSSSSSSPAPFSLWNTTFLEDGSNVTAPAECRYSVSWELQFALWTWLEAAMKGKCWWDSTLAMPRNLSHVMCAEHLWWLQPLYNNGFATLDSVSRLMDGVVASATDRMRVVAHASADNAATDALAAGGTGGSGSGSGNGSGSGGGASSSTEAVGTVWEATVCTTVDWPWLALPAALVLMTMGLLAAIVVKSRIDRWDRPVWKSSLLPLLFHGLLRPAPAASPSSPTKGQGAGEGRRDEGGVVCKSCTHCGTSGIGPAELGDMRALAGRMVVRLVPGPDGTKAGFLVVGEAPAARVVKRRTWRRGNGSPEDANPDTVAGWDEDEEKSMKTGRTGSSRGRPLREMDLDSLLEYSGR